MITEKENVHDEAEEQTTHECDNCEKEVSNDEFTEDYAVCDPCLESAPPDMDGFHERWNSWD